MLKTEKRNHEEMKKAASIQNAFVSIGYKRCGSGLLERKPRPFRTYFFALKDGSVIVGFRGTEVSLSVETGKPWNYKDAVAFLPTASESEIVCGEDRCQ